MRKIWLIQLITFLSAFLLFQIELIIGKIFLPNFGGSYLVWGACVVFFQAALLLGYLYAHFVIKRFGIAKYRAFHSIVMCVPFFFFPGRFLDLRFPLAGWPMVFEVFWKLIFSIGPVFFVLSTMSIIWQAWLAQSSLKQRDNPYCLFAVSNFGSFLALLTYPFIFEMYFDINVQQTIWRFSYVGIVILQAVALKMITVQESEKIEEKKQVKLDYRLITQWLLYGAAGVIIFLAVTNMITAEIAPAPLFWILPLAIYLLSFVFNFKQKPWCPTWIAKGLYGIMGFGLLFYFLMIRKFLPTLVELIVLLIYLFVVCMFCQYQIYKLKPQKNDLTFFYFIISLGSFLGGILATWIVPLIATSHLEYFIGLLCISFAWQINEKKRVLSVRNLFWVGVLILLSFQGPILLLKWKYLGLSLLVLCFGIIFFNLRKNRHGLSMALIITILLIQILNPIWSRKNYVYTHRNYYGITKIFETDGLRFLMHGTTIHGGQFLDKKRSLIPLTYYNPKSPASRMLIENSELNRIAIIGLGTGALSVYLKYGQGIDYFELDKDMYTTAQKYFTFLNRSAGYVKHIFGDARLSLEAMPPQKYPLIIVDAFSGDSIPVHLLTTQAMSLYRRHLTENGVILLHITNRYLRLTDPVAKTADVEGAYIGYQRDLDDISRIFKSDWVALTWDKNRFDQMVKKGGWKQIDKDRLQNIRPWTDQYSNVLPYFKTESLASSFKNINSFIKF